MCGVKKGAEKKRSEPTTTNDDVKLQSLLEKLQNHRATSGGKRNKNQEETHLFVKFDPCEVTFGVCVLQAKEPNLTQADCLDDLVEELLAGGALLDGELQLGVHRRDTNI